MEKFWIEFNEIFKQHGDAAARSGKRISFGTHHIRRGYLRRDFHLLRGGGLLRLEHGQVVRERRFKLGSPYNLKAKHIRALIDDWLADFRWHDLRHTWASWHVQQGTPLHALQELGGWETAEMVRRYAHLAPEHLAEYAERLAKPRVVDSSGTNLAQAENGPENQKGHIAVAP